jgi:hypothetical protein
VTLPGGIDDVSRFISDIATNIARVYSLLRRTAAARIQVQDSIAKDPVAVEEVQAWTSWLFRAGGTTG